MILGIQEQGLYGDPGRYSALGIPGITLHRLLPREKTHLRRDSEVWNKSGHYNSKDIIKNQVV